jgi:hypothetical protein
MTNLEPTNNWNQKPLTSHDRIRAIAIDQTFGKVPSCYFELENVVLDANGNVVSSTGAGTWTLGFDIAAQDPILGPYVAQIAEGFAGLTAALYAQTNPGVPVTPDAPPVA